MPEMQADSDSSPSDQKAIYDRYQQRLEEQNALVETTAAKWRSVGFLRGSSFIFAFILLVCGFLAVLQVQTPWFIGFVCGFVAFLTIVFIHEGIFVKLHKQKLERSFTRRSIAVLRRDWNSLPDIPAEIPPSRLAVANDLDLFGKASLMKLVCTAQTPLGIQKIADWISEPASVEEVSRRQPGVAELKGQTEHRDRLSLLGNLVTNQHGDPKKLMDWAGRPTDQVGGNLLQYFARFMTVFNFVAVILGVTQLIPFPIAILVLLAGLAINFITTVFSASKIHNVFNEVAARQPDAEHYLQLIKLICTADVKSEYLVDQQTQLKSGSISAYTAFADLTRRTWMANLRRNSLLFIVVYLPLQFFALWDIHILRHLANWRTRYGENVANWFDAIANWEAISSLAKLANDHPSCRFPTVELQDLSSAKLQATRITHPLLPVSDAVPNSVEVGPVGTILWSPDQTCPEKVRCCVRSV